jgi:hypothetical protein
LINSWEPASAFQTDDNLKAFQEYIVRTKRANAAGAEQLMREERRKALREGCTASTGTGSNTGTGTGSCSADGAGTGSSEVTTY